MSSIEFSQLTIDPFYDIWYSLFYGDVYATKRRKRRRIVTYYFSYFRLTDRPDLFQFATYLSKETS